MVVVIHRVWSEYMTFQTTLLNLARKRKKMSKKETTKKKKVTLNVFKER